MSAENPSEAIMQAPYQEPLPYRHNRRWKFIANSVWNVLALLSLVILVIIQLSSFSRGGGQLLGFAASHAVTIAMIVPMLILLMASGEIDLSIGAVASLSAMVAALLIGAGTPIALALLASLPLGLAIGVAHGLLVGVARLNGALVTVASAALIQGIAIALRGESGPLRGDRDQVGVAVWILGGALALLLTVSVIVLVNLTPFGRRPAPGDPPEPILRRALWVGLPFAVSGMMAALAGALTLARLGFADPAVGLSLGTQALLAALIGGTPLAMGVANGFGGLLGAVIVVLLSLLQSRLQAQAKIPVALFTGLAFVAATLIAHLAHGLVGWLGQRRKAAASERPDPAPG